jgi:serine/threonine protein kinase
LQKKGVCHRDVSLENIALDEQDRLVLIDPGMSLRVPYSDPCNQGCVTDVSAGTCRRLMIAQGQGGKLTYTAPEVIAHQEVVDPFAIDLWSTGVVLFVMLVGLAPFKWAHPSDKRFAKMSRGGLKDLMDTLDIPLSPEAIDLLQGFFWSNPRRRLTLAEVMDHPWVQGKQFVDLTLKAPKAPKKFTFGTQERRKGGTKGCETLSSKFRQGVGRPRLVTPHF